MIDLLGPETPCKRNKLVLLLTVPLQYKSRGKTWQQWNWPGQHVSLCICLCRKSLTAILRIGGHPELEVSCMGLMMSLASDVIGQWCHSLLLQLVTCYAKEVKYRGRFLLFACDVIEIEKENLGNYSQLICFSVLDSFGYIFGWFFLTNSPQTFMKQFSWKGFRMQFSLPSRFFLSQHSDTMVTMQWRHIRNLRDSFVLQLYSYTLVVISVLYMVYFTGVDGSVVHCILYEEVSVCSFPQNGHIGFKCNYTPTPWSLIL